MESYFDLVLGAGLNFYSFFNQEHEIKAYFSDSDNIFCSIVSIICTLAVVVTPILAGYLLMRDFKLIFYKDPETLEKYEVFIGDCKTDIK